MRKRRMGVGAVFGVALGLTGVLALDAGTGQADGQRGFTVSPAQLKINQSISQAAVRRSNRSLNYLAPVRTGASDAADTGRSGVTPLAAVPGSGRGWTAAQIADGAITTGKLAADAVGGAQIADGAVGEAALSADLRRSRTKWIVKVDNMMGVPVTRGSSPAFAMTRLATGTYLTDFGVDVRGCNWTATPTIDSGVPAAQTARTMPDPGGNPNRVLTETFNGAGFLVDSGVGVQVYC
jgi:hypothetical protein